MQSGLEHQYGILDYCIRAKVRAILCFGFSMTLREGNREYYYHMLGRWFPGLKARYVSHFGSSYACKSPNNEGLSVPKIDLVVAIASKIISKPLDRWPLIEKCIIPALGD